MSNQIVISSGAKVRDLDGVLTGTSGIVSSVPLGAANGVATLDSGGKVPVSQLPSSVVTYLGTWNAATNTPTLVNGTGDAGDMYICNVAGTVNFGAGPVTFAVGDWVLYGSGTWQKSNGQNGTVTSVAVTESGDALTITGSPITTAGTINIGFAGTTAQYVNGAGGLTTFPSLTGFVPYTGATTNVDLGIYELSAQNAFLNGVSGINGGNLFLRQDIDFGQSAGYTTLYSTGKNLGFVSYVGSFTYNALFSLNSLTNNSTRTFTLPDLSGTLALLEGTQTFTGTKTFGSSVSINTAGQADLSIVSSAGNSSNINSFVAGVLKSTISTSATEFKLISAIDNILKFQSSTNFRASLIFSNSADYNYTFPAASGTLALTSDLSSYVPYTGATNNVDLGSNYITSATIVFWKGTGSGLGNIGIGRIVPLGQNTTGQGNIGIGENSLFSNTTGSNNIAIGVSSTQANTTGINNIGIGLGSNSNNVTGSANVAVGVGALNFNTNNYNTAVGHLALYFNTTGTNNVAIGYSSLYTNTTGSQNTALGSGTLYSNTTASNNTAIGNQALQQNTTGVNNTAIGSFSNYVNTTGQNNTSVGASSLSANTTGSQNTALGSASLQQNTTGIGNTSIGYASLSVNTSGNYNVSLGGGNGNAITTGSSNILIGYNTGNGITTGSNNTIIGGGIFGLSATLSNNIILADGAGNIRYQWNGTNNVFGNPLSGTSASFASSGGSDSFAINHSSGSGIALNITKGGNGEGLYINKTSGSGNAATIIGTLNATTLVKSGGTSSQYLMADGSTSTLTNPVTGTGTTNYLPKFTGASTIGNSLLFDNGTNVGIGTTNPQANLHIQSTQASMNMRSTGTGSPYIDFYTSSSSLVGNFYALNGGGLAWGTSNGTERMRLDNSGNLGLGVTPSAWRSVDRALQIGLGSFWSDSQLTANFSQNHYFSSTGRKYIANGRATDYEQYDGYHAWKTAPSGTAGNAISFTQAMTLASTGNLLLGTTTDAGYKLDVNGTGRFVNNGISTAFGDASSFVLNSVKSTLTGSQTVAILIGKANSFNNQMTLLYNHVSDGSTSNFLGLGFYGADNLFKLYATGAATFSSSVTAGGISSTGTNTMLSASSSTAGLIVRGGSSIGTPALASGQIFVGQTASYRMSLAYDDNTGYAYIDNLWDNANSNIYFRVRTNGTPINALTLFGSGAATFSSLAGTGSRAVLADSSGTLSAPVSDISVKQNISTIGYGLSEILKMNPVWFDFIDEYKNYGEGRQNGMIAQEMADIIPEAVFVTPSTGKMGINYDQMHAVYIKAIQQLEERIKQLENK